MADAQRLNRVSHHRHLQVKRPAYKQQMTGLVTGWRPQACAKSDKSRDVVLLLCLNQTLGERAKLNRKKKSLRTSWQSEQEPTKAAACSQA